MDLLKFNIIHANFSYEVLTYTVTADVMAKIKHCFSVVISEDLNPTPMKTATPMVISLWENGIPLKVLAAKRVPRRYEEPAKATIQDLINKGVLAQASDVPDWCSQGLFVTKSDGRVCLVTDFTPLNMYGNRLIHPFPSTRDILQVIPHDAVYFLKMDAVQGYFKRALSEVSSLLTIIWAPTLEELQE